MTFRELQLKPSYETLNEDPVRSFYVPVLENAVSYDRIAGFFSSTSLALAARGILGLITNGGHMRLIASPKLSTDDYEAIRSSCSNPQLYLEQAILNGLEDLGRSLRDNHVRALGWMLASGMLEMRIAYVYDGDSEDNNALFHQKVGLLRDKEGNRISFSGSINETASGWLRNSEEFKVFCEWDGGQRAFYQSDEAKFEEFWNGDRPYVKVYKPSQAFNERIMRLGNDFDADKLALECYVIEQQREEARESIPLFPYQTDAVEAWEENDGRLLFEMATGTGKTRTAIACVNIAKAEATKFVCITAAPEITLVRQWKGEYAALGVSFDSIIHVDGTSGGKKAWVPAIRRALSRMTVGFGNSLLILVTHASSCSPSFISLFEGLSKEFTLCFVGDEVHGLGAKLRQKALLERYDLRIGLSATPSRWFDDTGTSLLVEYFGSASYSFGIREAQLTTNPLTGFPFLAPYRYKIVFVCLGDDEMDRYVELTARICRLTNSDDPEMEETLERLLSRRADIAKNAAEKLPAFEGLIKDMGHIDMTLVFTSSQQIDEVCAILSRNGICVHPFTQEQGTRKLARYDGLSEREYLIREFRSGSYQALVAIKCLDEGIDIPEADTAILMSSSTNPREYIQRIGRVIRYHEHKETATIVDFVVEPDWSRIQDPELARFERTMFDKELNRVREMAENADNAVDVLLTIDKKIGRIYGA